MAVVKSEGLPHGFMPGKYISLEKQLGLRGCSFVLSVNLDDGS
jgi:hypothetical protein